MADSKTTVLTKLFLGASIATAAAIGSVTLYTDTGHFTGNLSGSGTLAIESTSTFEDVMSGAQLDVTPKTGTAGLVLFGGAKGSHLCVRDTDGAGWTVVDTLNGSVTAHTASAGECP